MKELAGKNLKIRIPLAKEGQPFIIIPLALALGAIPVGLWLFLPLFAFGLFALWFFRDPERYSPSDSGAVISPADGTVIAVDQVASARLLDQPMTRVSIFMSVFNVHVNRAPLTGRVERTQYNPGKFFAANLDKASLDNEQNAVVLRDPDGRKIMFVQIAGLIARRIVCYINPGDDVVRGQRIGLIRFGSRLDVYLPTDAAIEVAMGQKVRAGETILGRFAQVREGE